MMKQKQQTSQTQKLAFVIQTPSSNSKKDNQKLIRSHAARRSSSRKVQKQMESWMLKREDKSTALQVPDGCIPGRVGSNLSLLDFPEPLKPYMENDIVRWFHGMKGALYPSEICLQVDAMQSSWTTNLLIDQIYFHAVIFSIETYFDLLVGRQGTLSHFYFAKTLRLLQERLNNPHDLRTISDATIMVIVMLGLSAELIGDRDAAENHVAGMKRIVDLRGGLEGLRFDNPRLPAKVCRVDIGLALRFGCKTVFFNNDNEISWNPYLSAQSLIRGMGKVRKRTDSVNEFIKALDPRLVNVWRDLEDFSTLSNLASQTDRKLQPNTFSEIMVSLLYRLLALASDAPLENAVRLGMAMFAASIFFRWRDMKQRQAYLDDSFRNALAGLRETAVRPPSSVLLWLLVLWETNVAKRSGSDEFLEWTVEVLRDVKIDSWDGIRAVLKTVIWIDCLFDTSGRRIFKPILERVNGQASVD